MADAPSARKVQTCKTYSSLAKTIMSARQNGIPMADMMEKVAAMDEDPVKNLASLMVTTAYDTNRFSSEEYKQKAVSDFENTFFSSCIKSKLQ